MFEKIEIIYDFNGYKDPKIKDVELTRVNGYKTIITKEGERIMEEYKLVNILAKDAKKILELLDEKNISVEEIELFIKKRKEVEKMSDNEKTDDEIRFTEEEKKVEKYLEDHKSENLTYRDAVLACLDRTEPEVKKVFSENEKKQKEDLKKVEDWLLLHPRSSYSEAVRVVLKGESISLEERLVKEYQAENKCDYRTAVLAVLSESETKEE